MVQDWGTALILGVIISRASNSMVQAAYFEKMIKA
jgi:hypothetical protein